MSEYRKLLSESEDDPRLRKFFKRLPLFPHVLIENRCPLAQNNRSDLFFMPDPTQPKSGHRHLYEFTNDASDLVIVDPYLFPAAKKYPSELKNKFRDRQQRMRKEHEERFLDSISLEGTQHIHVVVDRDKLDSKLYDKVQQKLDESSIKMTKQETDKIHDRIWIKNISNGKTGCSAKVVGTSLNGLGKKAAFILDLPYDDLAAIIKFMGDHSLLGPLQDHLLHFA